MSREDPQLRIRLPSELKEKIEMSAKSNSRSMNAEIVEAINLWISVQNKMTANLPSLDEDYKFTVNKGELASMIKDIQLKTIDMIAEKYNFTPRSSDKEKSE